MSDNFVRRKIFDPTRSAPFHLQVNNGPPLRHADFLNPALQYHSYRPNPSITEKIGLLSNILGDCPFDLHQTLVTAVDGVEPRLIKFMLGFPKDISLIQLGGSVHIFDESLGQPKIPEMGDLDSYRQQIVG